MQMRDAMMGSDSVPVPKAASIPKAGLIDTLAVFGQVLIPTVAKGVIIRRPAMLSIAEQLDLDRRAIRRMQHIRKKYGSGPLLLRLPGRTLALIRLRNRRSHSRLPRPKNVLRCLTLSRKAC